MVTRMLAFARGLEPRTALTTADAVRFALWPLAIMTMLQRVFIKAMNGDITDDFQPVYKAALAFLNHRAVYTENLDTVNPHYLYPPGGTLLMAPLAVIDPAHSRSLFIVANAIALIIAWYLLLRLFKLTLRSVAAPVLLFAMFMSETVTNTLTFGNMNGFVLLAEMAYLHLLLARREMWAGAALGLTFIFKPILLPLLLIALARRQWKACITAIAVPLAVDAIAWPLSVDPMTYLTKTTPYWLSARDYFNSSIVGNSQYYGIPSPMAWLVRILFAAMVAVSLWLLYRYYRDDELFFVCTATGVIMTAVFLIGSLGQMYYSMMIFPLLMTVVLRNSVIRNWPAWLAIFGFMSYDKWLLYRENAWGRNLEYLRITFGWSLLLIVIFCVLGDRWLAARRENRLDSGLDAPELIEPSPSVQVPVSVE